MKAYSAYKPSGIDWLGQIPSHWKTTKLKYCVEISNGSDPILEGDIPVYGTGELPFKTCGEYKDGPTVLLGRKGSISTPHWIEGKYWNVDTAFDTKVIDSYQLRYFWYVANILDVNPYKSTTAIPSMTQTAYENMIIPVPPLGEQEAIAAYLDLKTAKIDALIDEKRRQLEDLRSYRTSLISETVTRGLNPDAPLRPSGIDWLGQIPTHWTKTRLKYFITQITTPSLSDRKVALENIESNTGRYIESSSEFEGNGVEFKAGDILYGKLRPYLKKVWLAEFDGNAIGDFFVYRPNDNANGRYVKWLFLSHGFSSIVNQSTDGAKMPRVSSDFIKSLCYYLPPPSEQQEIADYLDEKTAKIDALIDEMTKQIDELTEYKQAVITEAVTGKVDVRDYKPNNESHAHAS